MNLPNEIPMRRRHRLRNKNRPRSVKRYVGRIIATLQKRGLEPYGYGEDELFALFDRMVGV